MKDPASRSSIAPAVALTATLLLLALAPSLGARYWGVWHYRLTNALYFLPQYVFPFGYTWRPLPEPSPDAAPIGHPTSLLVWVGAVTAFGWLGRRLPPRWVAVLVPALIGAMMLAQQLLFKVLGLHFWCDGP